MVWNTITIVILLLAVFILTGLCIYFIYTNSTNRSTLISPSQCPTQVAQFGVTPRTVGKSIISRCGTANSSICTFNNITNLGEAVDICNRFADFCTMFSYSPNVISTGSNTYGVMSIMLEAAGVSASTSYDTYIQQVPTNLVV